APLECRPLWRGSVTVGSAARGSAKCRSRGATAQWAPASGGAGGGRPLGVVDAEREPAGGRGAPRLDAGARGAVEIGEGGERRAVGRGQEDRPGERRERQVGDGEAIADEVAAAVGDELADAGEDALDLLARPLGAGGVDLQRAREEAQGQR